MRTTKTLIRLRGSAGLFESSMGQLSYDKISQVATRLQIIAVLCDKAGTRKYMLDQSSDNSVLYL